MKKCPKYAEEIQKEAVKCKHCWENTSILTKEFSLWKLIVIIFFLMLVYTAFTDKNNYSWTSNYTKTTNNQTSKKEDSNLSSFCDNENVLKRIDLNKRKGIFKEILSAEDRATLETESLYPIDSSNTIYWSWNKYLRDKYKENSTKYFKLSEELMGKYRSEVLDKYWISEDEWFQITTEAVCKNWF